MGVVLSPGAYEPQTSHPALPLSQLEVLIVDCQATAAAPGGHLLELAWGWSRTAVTDAHAYLVCLPEGVAIAPAVARITGISEAMVCDGVEGGLAWSELAASAAARAPYPAPTVIHFAQFERPFLRALAGGEPPLDVVCTHAISRRLFPELPRRSLRALVGYLGGGVGPLRRGADHVEATAFLWRRLIERLEAEGITTWSALRDWLAAPLESRKLPRKVWPMPRETRLALPHGAGIYRMLRSNGDVLYVGKAASLRARVNSYFRKQHGVDDRLLEMLTQARALSFETAATPLEAALAEADEIKRCRPPYNVALTIADRALWFASPDLGAHESQASPSCPLGPFGSAETLRRFDALARVDATILASGRWDPDLDAFHAGYGRLCAEHPELARSELSPHARLLRLGTRLWREGRRDRDVEDEAADTRADVAAWTPELVQLQLERLPLRAALLRRRAMWLTRFVDATVRWREPGQACARLLVIEGGEIASAADADPDVAPPIPPGYRRPVTARRERFSLATYDRLRVLTTELKRLAAAGAPVAVRFGTPPALADARLAAALWWV